MADIKISALPASTTPLAGTEVVPLVQSGVTRQVSVANLTAGRAVSAASMTLSTGNLVIETSGQGIDFSTTPGTGTSELFSDYEEGTWTPSISATTPGNLTVVFSSQSGVYTKIGRTVTVTFFLTTSTFTHTTASGEFRITGLPFTVTNTAGAAGYSTGALVSQGWAKTNYGVTLASVQNATEIRIAGTGSGQNLDNILITNFVTGGLVIMRGSLTYLV